tara:strand:+ start:50 stop:262 length:213 start_codon:yes stop_codon:yes gene_type:complete
MYKVTKRGNTLNKKMPYEPSTNECRVLIDCKIHIESMLVGLGTLNETDKIQKKLIFIYKQLDDIQEDQKK